MDAETFWNQVDASGDCWEWTGKRAVGYGTFYAGENRNQFAHRASYELLIGPIAPGLVIDHLCRNSLCVNPDHLEPVTDRTNVLRGYGLTARQARQTHCKYGHDLAITGRVDRRGHRGCAECKRVLDEAYRPIHNAKRREARVAAHPVAK